MDSSIHCKAMKLLRTILPKMSNPAELNKVLEFDKTLDYIKQYAVSESAKEKVRNIMFRTQRSELEIELDRAVEFQNVLALDDPCPFYEIKNIHDDLRAAAIRGNFLTIAAVLRIFHSLTLGRLIHHYFARRRSEYTNLWRVCERLVRHRDLEDAITAVIDVQTQTVKSSASAKLAKIRKAIDKAQRDGEKTIQKLFGHYSSQGILQENLIALRGGRQVLPVRREHRARVKGLVHDQSATGSTVFVEPLESLELNNELVRLQAEEGQEMQRLLTELTALVAVHSSGIKSNWEILTELDFIRAKALFAQKLNCAKPKMNDSTSLEIYDGRHPLLQLHKEAVGTIVPLNLKLNGELKTLVISGPNAGGKSVALKTVGLLSLMLQCGIPIPIHPDSKIPIFERIFADIGDSQSIENDLSTFSSHVAKMKDIILNANRKSLVLVDEIGAGTDPDEGAALSIAFLEALTKRGSLTIVTTHHGTLKAFAYDTPGVENGSMEFSLDTLEPEYRFRLNTPGSSYALEISRRLGISERIITRARQLVGEQKDKLENLLIELERRTHAARKLEGELETAKSRFESLSRLYEKRYESLKQEEGALKRKALEESQVILNESNAIIERTIKEIRENQGKSDVVSDAKRAVERRKQQIRESLQEMSLLDGEKESSDIELVEGEEVFWQTQGSIGRLVSCQAGAQKVLIQIDNLKFWVSPLELRKPKKKASETDRVRLHVQIKTEAREGVLPEIDLRGTRVADALQKVDKFLDDAILAGWEQVRIIHGKGTGALREEISKYLEGHDAVRKKELAPWNQGDAGVTIVDLR